MVLEVGGKAALVAHAGDMAVLLQNGLKGVEDFCADAQRIAEGHGAHGHDHEFLNIQIVGSVRAAVDDVHHGHGQHLGVDAAKILVERQTQKFRGHTGASHGNTQHGIGTKAGLVVRAVKVDERVVDLHLAQHIHANNGFGDFAVDVVNGLGHALAAKTAFVAIAHFKSFAAARGGSRRHGRTGAVTGFQRHFHFNSGVAARIEDLTAINRSNAAHCRLLLPWRACLRKMHHGTMGRRRKCSQKKAGP